MRRPQKFFKKNPLGFDIYYTITKPRGMFFSFVAFSQNFNFNNVQKLRSNKLKWFYTFPNVKSDAQ